VTTTWCWIGEVRRGEIGDVNSCKIKSTQMINSIPLSGMRLEVCSEEKEEVDPKPETGLGVSSRDQKLPVSYQEISNKQRKLKK
jgi:hypothetical protein